MVGFARAIEEMGFDSVWVVDHIAIPPDDADGIGARYCGCLVQPGLARRHYRTGQSRLRCLDFALFRGPAPTAKQIATIQELSGNRLLMGMGIGWMTPELEAFGLNRHTRGRVSDETLAFLDDCFANDEMEKNG